MNPTSHLKRCITRFKDVTGNNHYLVKTLSDYSGLEYGFVFNLIQFVKCMLNDNVGIVDEFIFTAVMAKYFGLHTASIVESMYHAAVSIKAQGATILDIGRVLCIFYTKNLDLKIDFVFNVYDVNKNKHIDKSEVATFLRDVKILTDDDFDHNEAEKSFLYYACQLLGVARDKPITLDDFRVRVKRDEIFLQLLGKCLPSQEDANQFRLLLEKKSLTEIRTLFGDLREKLLFQYPMPANNLYPVMLELP